MVFRTRAARYLAVVVCLGNASSVGLAKECVYLTSGFSLEADSHTLDAGVLGVQPGSGTLECRADQILRIESLPPSPAAERAVTQGLSSQEQPAELILSEAAYRQGVDEDFVHSVAKVESGLRQQATSRKGAVGLMQLMPSTAAELHVDPSLAPENARGGATYLRQLLIRYHGNSALALAAYNAGPGAVERFGGVPPYEETRRYIVQVLREYQRRVKARKADQISH